MADEALDYSEFQPDEDEVAADKARLEELCMKLIRCEQAVEEAQDALKQRQKDLLQISEHDIPELMDKIGKKRTMLQSGMSISLKEQVTGNISEANKEKAFAWLRENGHGGLIKREIKVALGKGQDNMATAAFKTLEDMGLEPADKETIHAQTLGAFIREQLEADKKIPEDLLGVFRKRSAKIG